MIEKNHRKELRFRLDVECFVQYSRRIKTRLPLLTHARAAIQDFEVSQQQKRTKGRRSYEKNQADHREEALRAV